MRPADARDAARRAARIAAHGWGLDAETLALVVLLLKGYRPLARRYAAQGGEIDLIVKRGDAVAFVEVKARGSVDAAATAITATKRRRFSRAARAWLARNPWAMERTLRADAVFVARGRWPRHLANAFPLEF